MTPFVAIGSNEGLGGAERALLHLFAGSARLREAGTYVSLAADAGGGGGLSAALGRLGVRARRMPGARGRDALGQLRVASRLAGLAAERRAPLLLANGLHAAVPAALAALAGRSRLAIWMHDLPWAPLLRGSPELPLVAVLARGAVWLCNSEATRAALQARLGPVRTELLHPGVDVARFASTARRASLARGRTRLVFAQLARLQAWKGQEIFLRAAARVAARLPEARFRVIGGNPFGAEPPFAGELRALASSLGLAGRVEFPGQVDDAAAALADVDVLVHPPIAPEAFGMVIAEALAAGKPVIASDIGGIPEILAGSEAGVLVPPGDVEALAAAMLALAKPEARRRRARTAAATAARFSIEASARAAEACLERCA